MTTSKTAEVKAKTWYGLTARIAVTRGGLHHIGVGPFMLPHPPVVNSLLRFGLPETTRMRLTVAHEMGHFQALPFEVLYGVLLVTMAHILGDPTWLDIVLIVISVFASWEMLAEGATMLDMGDDYDKAYHHARYWPRVVFWSLMPLLTFTGWAVLVIL